MRNTNCFKELAGCLGWQAQLSALISGPEGAGSTPPACWRTPDRAGMQAAHHLHAPARHQVCGPDGPALPSLLPAHTCPLSSHCMGFFRGGAQTSAAPEPAFVPPAARRCCGGCAGVGDWYSLLTLCGDTKHSRDSLVPAAR